MSLSIAFKSPEGIVLAADSRVTLMAALPGVSPGGAAAAGSRLLRQRNKAAVAPDSAVRGHHDIRCRSDRAGRTADCAQLCAGTRRSPGRIPWERALERRRCRGCELGDFYKRQWDDAGMPAVVDPGQQMVFFVAGFDENSPYGRIFEVKVPDALDPVEQNVGTFGITWGGQHELVGRLLNGTDPRGDRDRQGRAGP